MDKHRRIKKEPIKKDVPLGHIDYMLLSIVTMLAVFGIIMVFDSSFSLLSNKYHFIIFQAIWVAIGFAGMFVVSRYDYTKIAKLALPLMVTSIILLISVLFVGEKINGAVRWINLGFFQLQPSEIAKPVFIIYLASWFSKPKPEFDSVTQKIKFSILSELLPFLMLTFLIVGLVVLGKDLGTAIVLAAIALGMYFIQGDDILSLLNTFLAIASSVILAVLAIIIEPYRLQRILTFSGQSKDPLKEGYQISQILIAIGSGGLFGRGFTQSIQKQRYLVETTAATDSIFAVIAEEFGFVGSIILICGYLFLFYRCIMIAVRSQDKLAKLLVCGIVIWIISQTLLNIAVNVNIVPLTGVPLPFISYGGSATIMMLATIGIVLNISRHIHGEEQD